jgi:hypothetical protein
VMQGAVAVGDTVEIGGARETRKVKSLQRFHQPCRRVEAGERVGVCVTKFPAARVERSWLSAPRVLHAFSACVCLVQRCRFYTGAASTQAVQDAAVHEHAHAVHAQPLCSCSVTCSADPQPPQGVHNGRAYHHDGTRALLWRAAGRARRMHAGDACAVDVCACWAARCRRRVFRPLARVLVPGAAVRPRRCVRRPRASTPCMHRGIASCARFHAMHAPRHCLVCALPRHACTAASPRVRVGRPCVSEDPSSAGLEIGGEGAPLHFGHEWALLVFDRPVLAPAGSVVVCSRLDMDLEHAGTTCRIAFYGNVVQLLEDDAARAQLRLFRVCLRRALTCSAALRRALPRSAVLCGAASSASRVLFAPGLQATPHEDCLVSECAVEHIAASSISPLALRATMHAAQRCPQAVCVAVRWPTLFCMCSGTRIQVMCAATPC